MKKSLFILFFLYNLNFLQAQYCDSLLSYSIPPIEQYELFIMNLRSLMDCGKVELDAFDFESPMIGNILMQMAENKSTSFTYQDLITAIEKHQETEEYQKGREIYNRIQELKHQKVPLSNWQQIDKQLSLTGLPDEEIKHLKLFIESRYETDQKVSYETVFNDYRYSLPQLGDVHTIDDEGFLSPDDYFEQVELAKENELDVLIYFSGYGAENARRVEQTSLSDPYVLKFLSLHYNFIVLYVDDRRVLTEAEQQKYSKLYKKKIRTVGNLNAAIQVDQFKIMVQPYFVILNKNGDFVNGIGYVTDREAFLNFLLHSEKK